MYADFQGGRGEYMRFALFYICFIIPRMIYYRYLLTAYAKKAMDNMRDLSQLHTDIRASIKSNMIFNTLIDLGHYLKYR